MAAYQFFVAKYYVVLHNSQFIRSISCISGYVFWLIHYTGLLLKDSKIRFVPICGRR